MQKRWLLPLALMGVLALSRIPGCLPENFSAVYALLFCAGVYFPGRFAWWVPLTVMVGTDIGLNAYYQTCRGIPAFDVSLMKYLAINYCAYAFLIWLGRRFRSSDRLLSLLGGGVLGAVTFYLLTNTAAWLFNPFQNPEYTRNLTGWLIAMTKGTAGYPQTWEFFRNTLISGGLFTGLFVGSAKLIETPEDSEEATLKAGEDDEPQEAEA